MRLVAESGLWCTGPQVPPPPAAAVLEVSGAVLEWAVDETAAARITFTDVTAADWLWRLVGPDGHTAVLGGIGATHASNGLAVDIEDVEVSQESLVELRRLAFGHWLRRWWPASHRDGIAVLDAALLDAEIAVLTADAQEYFSEDTFDSDVADLLAPHRDTLAAAVRSGDPRAVELVSAVVTLAADVGVGDWSEIMEPQHDSVQPRRDDYALAAGRTATVGGDAVARGESTVNWTAVPHGVFDAAEHTVEWSARWSGTAAVADIHVEVVGSADGVPVRFDSGSISGHAALDQYGNATVQLAIDDGPVSETVLWSHHWGDTSVSVGAAVAEPEQLRSDVRAFARARLSGPHNDSFLAEILAAEADY